MHCQNIYSSILCHVFQHKYLNILKWEEQLLEMQNEDLVFWEIKQKQVSLFKTRANICQWGICRSVANKIHLHWENILMYCVTFNLFLKISLLGLKKSKIDLFKTSETSNKRINSYVSIQRFKLNLCAKLEYSIKHLRIKYRFHLTSQREQNHHFLVNCGTKYH